MITVQIPQQADINIKHIVCDFNGTLAHGGKVGRETINQLTKLSKQHDVNIYVVTADTYGTVTEQFKGTIIQVKLVSKQNGTIDKANFVKELGANNCVAIGNGNNDIQMLQQAKIGICVIGKEGCATKTLIASDIAVNNIEHAINLLANPFALKATLRP